MATYIEQLTKRVAEKDQTVEDMQAMSQINYAQQMMQYSEAPSMQFEETNYVNNAQNDYRRQNYQSQGRPQQ